MPQSDYQRIEKAIHFILENRSQQPSLEEIAKSANLSPFHFQRLFSQWVGTTPKRFLQCLTLERAKVLLARAEPLLKVSEEIGLSGTSRLHDHFVNLEAITPGQFKTAGADLKIGYGIHQSPFGNCFIAETARGICKLTFMDDLAENETIAHKQALSELQSQWPEAEIKADHQGTAATAKAVFWGDSKQRSDLSLQVRGTNFQIMVWKALLQIPEGSLQTYGLVAQAIGKESASRAVGTAIGANPIAFLIPCHRVVRQSGAIGGYRWGETRKHALHAWESARTD